MLKLTCSSLSWTGTVSFFFTGSNCSSWTNISEPDSEDISAADLGLLQDHFSQPEVIVEFPI